MKKMQGILLNTSGLKGFHRFPKDMNEIFNSCLQLRFLAMFEIKDTNQSGSSKFK